MPFLSRFVLCGISLFLASATHAAPLQVAVSTSPLQTFVQRVGGDHVQVHSLVRPGFNPHDYEPTPKQISALTQAQLLIRIGIPFEAAWLERIKAANPRMKIIDVREGLTLRNEEPHAGHHHAEDSLDPHIWTSTRFSRHMVKRIRDTLIELIPEHAPAFTHNAAVFTDELEQLEKDITQALSDITSNKFMVLHPAWGHFAEQFGLTQVAIEHEGKAPGPRSLATLIAQARRENIRLILVQPQFSQRAARQIAQAIQGRVLVADPLASDYVATMRHVAAAIAEANQ